MTADTVPSPSLVAATGLTKAFGGVKALTDVDVNLLPGEVVALAGENGAGKSTLIRILTGLQQPDAGTIEVDGNRIVLNPARARELGIAVVSQELSVLDHLSVADNISLGREVRGRFGMVDRNAQRGAAARALARVGLGISPEVMVRDLSLAQRQLVEIAKSLASDPRVLILDEPTSGLREDDVQRLLALVRLLSDQGHAILFVTHRMAEIFSVSDRIVVLKDGRLVATVPTGATTEAELVRLMVGRDLSAHFPDKSDVAAGASVLTLTSFSVVGTMVSGVSLDVPRGRIVALAGLAGHGQIQLLEGIGGLRRSRGHIAISGRPRRPFGSVGEAVAAGVVLIPEDRKVQGLVLPMTVGENISLPTMGRRATAGWINAARERAVVRKAMDAMRIRPRRPAAVAGELSGGNQQKVVIGKWLASDPRVVLCADPTRGIDVATKQEIYGLLRGLVDRGVGVLMLSTDLSEIVGLADIVLVMAEGRLVERLEGSAITEEAITGAAFQAVRHG